MRLGIYIHFPWCRKRCPYCDFAVAIVKEEPPHRRYLEAMIEEFKVRAPLFKGKNLVSIYFGGGTPSLWDSSCMKVLIDTICEYFNGDKTELEISLESNPSDCQTHNFQAWQNAGVNRLLIGAQATNQQDLLTLGRDHSMGDGLAALERSQNAGFRSIGVDVILGVPKSASSLQSVIDIAGCSPPHISAYELTIEKRTDFAKQVRRGHLIPRSEDELASLYEETHFLLQSQGYEHYEVSSFAKAGHRSVHNSLYWEGTDYLGLGNGAASLYCAPDGSAQRWQNRRSASRYLERDPIDHRESIDEISITEFQQEKRWIAMRTRDGLRHDEIVGLEDVFERLVSDGLVASDNDRMRPTLKGFLYNNQLITRLANV